MYAAKAGGRGRVALFDSSMHERVAERLALEADLRRGVAEMLILKTLDYGKNTVGFTGAELGWTLEDNTLVNRTIEAVGGRKYKIHRIYSKEIG